MARFTITGEGGQSTTFTLTPGEMSIGRAGDNALVLEGDGMSRRHARITWAAGQFSLEDLGSKNGTFVNGERIPAPRALAHGDIVALPGWTLVSSEVDPQTSWHDQRQGEREVVVTLAVPSQTVRLLRQVSVPASAKCKLAVQVGHVPGGLRPERAARTRCGAIGTKSARFRLDRKQSLRLLVAARTTLRGWSHAREACETAAR